MTLKECVGIVAAMFVAIFVFAFVKAASMMPRQEPPPREGTVYLHHHAVDYDALERGTNGKAHVVVRREDDIN